MRYVLYIRTYIYILKGRTYEQLKTTLKMHEIVFLFSLIIAKN